MPVFRRSRPPSSKLAVVFAIGALSCAKPTPDTLQPESTRTMVARLQTLDADAHPQRNPYRADRLLAHYDALAPARDARGRLLQQLQRARALLDDGATQRAIDALAAIEAASTTAPDALEARDIRRVRSLAAIAYLRLGEQQNCLEHHNIDACLLPIQGNGIHHEKRGSLTAATRYEELLREHPDDLTSRWLLNLAHMTLGSYPDGVPTPWRLSPDAFPHASALPRLRNVAPAAGLDVGDLSGGVVVDDLDGDGLLDVMASSWSLSDPLRLFRNRGDGTFEDATRAAGLTGLNGGLNLVHADYDNDGRNDVLVLRGAWLATEGRHPNSLLRNVGAPGAPAFVDVTEAAGVLDFRPSQTAAWADFDGDGWLDLFVGNESTPGSPQPCRLFRNLGPDSRGQVTFADIASEARADLRGFVKAVVAGDVDQDGRPDLFVSRLGQSNVLLRNRPATGAASWRFEDITAQAGVEAPRNSFPAWFWDVDNDGRLDLFVSGYPPEILSGRMDGVAAEFMGLVSDAEKPRLYRNQQATNGGVVFDDVTTAWRLDRALYTMGSNFGDLDNDGWLDAYLGTGAPDLRALMPNRLFRNRDGTGFEDATWSTGTGHLQKGHGVAFADLDNDGDQDLYIVMGGAFSGDRAYNALFENPGFGHHWLSLRLVGVTANRSAIGARISLEVDSEAGARRIYATVSTGGSFGSASLQQELGLGRATRVRRLTVQWPGSGTVQTFDDLPMDRIWMIQEDLDTPKAVDLPTYTLGGCRPARPPPRPVAFGEK